MPCPTKRVVERGTVGSIAEVRQMQRGATEACSQRIPDAHNMSGELVLQRGNSGVVVAGETSCTRSTKVGMLSRNSGGVLPRH